MAFKLDDDLLQELGLAALQPQEKQSFLRHILETLEMRVGTTLAGQMSDGQLDEFEKLMPAEADTPETAQHKERQALAWLESNFPNYKQVVNNELEKLKAEIKQSAPQILASSQQAAQQPYAPQPPVAQNSSQPMMPFTQDAPQPPVSFSQPPQPTSSYSTTPSPQFSPQPPTQPEYPPQQPPYPPQQAA